MKRNFSLVFLALFLCLACNEKGVVPLSPSDGGQEPSQGASRIVVLNAEADASTRTMLCNKHILWSKDDEVRVSGTKVGHTAIVGTLSGTTQGYGIPVNAPGSALVRYGSIKIEETTLVDGERQVKDVTADITRQNPNPLLYGIYTMSGNYRYAPAGECVEAEINQSGSAYSIPLIQSSSRCDLSETHTVTVAMDDVEYSLDDGDTWHRVTSAEELRNGFGSKGKLSPEPTFECDVFDLRLSLTEGAGTTHATFEGTTASEADPSEGTLAVYPYSAVQGIGEGGIRVALPDRQNYAEESFGNGCNPMASTLKKDGDAYRTLFRNLCGALRLTLTGDCTLNTISVTDRAGQMLYGTANLTPENYADGIHTEVLAGGGCTLTLDCPGVTLTEDSLHFFFVVPVGAFSEGLTVTVTTDDGRSQTFGTDEDNTIVRSGIMEMQPMDISELIETVDVENETLRRYLSYGRYERFGSRSHFDTYGNVLNGSFCFGKDYPAPYHITWAGDADTEYTVSWTDETRGRTFSERLVVGNGFDFENLVPGHRYSYTVSCGSDKLRQGTFDVSGMVRFVRIADSWNYRDLGGWSGLGGKPVRYEWIYRGGSLNGTWYGGEENVNSIAVAANYTFSPEGLQQVEDIGIRAELDLRGKTGDGQPWSQESGMHSRSIEECHLPEGSDFIQIMTDQGLQNPMNVSSVVQDVAWIIQKVVHEGKPVAFHCKSGADRTGAVAMLIQALLGVHPGDIARDYELTTLSHENLVLHHSTGLSVRRADQAGYGFFHNGFTTLALPSPCDDAVRMQQQAYYYLNRYFAERGDAISASDLDAFICFMLDMDEGRYAAYRPSWAVETGNSLSSIFTQDDADDIEGMYGIRSASTWQ